MSDDFPGKLVALGFEAVSSKNSTRAQRRHTVLFIITDRTNKYYVYMYIYAHDRFFMICILPLSTFFQYY